jgi:hypothetical protein
MRLLVDEIRATHLDSLVRICQSGCTLVFSVSFVTLTVALDPFVR